MLYLATVRAGGVFLPLNTAYTPAEIEYFPRRCRAGAAFVCDPEGATASADRGQRVGAKVLTLGRRRRRARSPTRPQGRGPVRHGRAGHGEDLAAILYTSGTTGRSKGAMLTHDNLASNAETLGEYWRFTSDDVLIHALPIFHTHGLFVASNVVLFAGASMIFLPKFDAD